MEEGRFDFGKKYIILDYKMKKLQQNSVATASFSVDKEAFVVTLNLFNDDNLKINEASFDLPFDTLITSVDLDYENKKLVFQVVNGTPIECDISELIDVTTNLISTTWQELNDLRDASELIPGQQYRITDFVTTTVQSDTQSAGHAFDLIVVADSPNKLNEQARAIQHEGDTYFANSKLEAWQVWYCIDNDTDRFAWTDAVNGKGVIYRLIDEWNNDCPYDFKNIQFLRDYDYYYTFTAFENTDETIKDASIMREMAADDMVSGMTYNSMKPYYIYIDKFIYPQALSFNIFKSYYDDGNMVYMPSNNHLGLNCHNNFFDGTEFTHSNTFGNNCYSNTFGDDCRFNTFGDSCYSNTFGNDCNSNTLGDNCNSNTLGDNCSYNIFGNECNDNTFGYGCSSNTFGTACSGNIFGDSCSSNTFGNECNNNTFGNDCSSNTFGNGCNSNTFGDWCFYNTFGNGCYSSTFGNDCDFNTFEGACYYLKISENAGAKRYLNIDSGLQGASSANKLELYDSAIANKTYQINFKQDADGRILMTWQDDKLIEHGKYKNNNLDPTWKDIEGTIQHITWAKLKTLRDTSKLYAGQQYRITDFVTTTTQADTQSAGHTFDLIVVADSVNKLNEQARAIQHAGDTYFANSKLEAWKLKYCLDNDTNRFAWATSTGKGVIYWMKDEWNNECPYDFKNIQFIRKLTDGVLDLVGGVDTWVYTFNAYDMDSFNILDGSLLNGLYQIDDADIICKNNMVKSCNQEDQYNGLIRKQELNDIVFLNMYTFGDLTYFECYNNSFGNSCNTNTFGNNCYSNTFGNECSNNTFGDTCYYNTFGNHCNFNTFGDSCNTNTFGNNCSSNAFRSVCYYNTFGNGCNFNTFEAGCYMNTFGSGCNFNTFGDSCSMNTFGNSCQYDKITGDSARYLNIDNGIQGASSANKLELYDLEIVNKAYQVTFKKSASGRYLMLWATDTGAMTGKYKALNTDETWTAL